MSTIFYEVLIANVRNKIKTLIRICQQNGYSEELNNALQFLDEFNNNMSLHENNIYKISQTRSGSLSRTRKRLDYSPANKKLKEYLLRVNDAIDRELAYIQYSFRSSEKYMDFSGPIMDFPSRYDNF